MPPGANGPSGVQAVRWLDPGRSVFPARHVSHARVSGLFLGCYVGGNECGRGFFDVSRPITWSGPWRASGARSWRLGRASGACHVPVTLWAKALVLNHPIDVLCWHTRPVSAYRIRLELVRAGREGAVVGGTIFRAVPVSAYRRRGAYMATDEHADLTGAQLAGG